jgi:phenylacetaldehyde dehydrogenase
MATATLEMIDPKIRDFVTSKRRLLIDGKWVDAQSGETFPVYDPATGDVMDQCAAGDKADIDLAVKAARRAFERGPWSRLTHGQRGN